MLASLAHYGAYPVRQDLQNKTLPSFPLATNSPLAASISPQLALICNPGQIHFLLDDLNTRHTPTSVVLVDALVRNQAITGAQPLNPTS